MEFYKQQKDAMLAAADKWLTGLILIAMSTQLDLWTVFTHILKDNIDKTLKDTIHLQLLTWQHIRGVDDRSVYSLYILPSLEHLMSLLSLLLILRQELCTVTANVSRSQLTDSHW